jgi:RNA polymerase sigma-70 factor (ECF subfamily)
VPRAVGEAPEIMSQSPAPEPDEKFINAVIHYGPQIYAYVRALVPNWADAEEVFQETNAILWRQASKAPQVENVLAWSCGVARMQVLKLRDRKKRDRLEFSAEFMEAVAAEVVARSDELDHRREALARCIEGLSDSDRHLIVERYTHQRDVLAISQAVGRSADAVYKALNRVRRALLKCIESSLEGGAA